jgi:hypothetical protein
MTSITREFQVKEWDGDHLWCQLKEGKKRGLQFALTVSQDQLQELEEGDRIRASIESLNDKNTAWRLVSWERVPLLVSLSLSHVNKHVSCHL